MKEIKKVLLCGLGAIGTVYAEKFHNYDSANFRVLVNKERLDKYKKNPIVYNNKTINFNYILPSEPDYKADLIIITTKQNGLNDALDNIKNFVKEDTVIIPLLNGVTSEEITASKYGWDKVLYGYFIGHSAVRNGNSINHDGVNTLVFGGAANNVERIQKYFQKTAIQYSIPEDIRRSLWLKFMLNTASNPTTALLRMTFGEMLNNQKFMELAVKIMKEVQAIAKAEGISNTETMIDETVSHLQTMLPEGKTSMLQDIEAGRETEIDLFAGTVIELGKKHHIQTPYCNFLKEMFDIIHENTDRASSAR